MLPPVLRSSLFSTPVTIQVFGNIFKFDKMLFSHRSRKHLCIVSFAFKKQFVLNVLSGRQHRLLSSNVQHTVESPHAQETQEIETDSNAKNSFFAGNYEELTNGDPQLEKKLKVILSEIYVMYEEGKDVPSKILPEHLKVLLSITSRSGRFQHLRYLFITEKRKEQDLAKKATRQAEREAFLKQQAENPVETLKDQMEYGLKSNTMLLRIYESSIDKFNNWRLFQAKLLGPQIVIDFGYREYMNYKDSNLCAKQVMQGFGENRIHNFPLHLIFCNYNKDDTTAQRLLKLMPVLYEPHFPFEWRSESYLDLFPKEKLVYLTPHCKEELKMVNGDDIYIIGAMVDQSSGEPVSLGKAKKEGIRMAKFPLDQYLDWGSGKKNLTINQCMMIMADMMWRKDWRFAFERWIPKRKLMSKDHVHYASKELQRLKRFRGSTDPDFQDHYQNKQSYQSDQHYQSKHSYGSNQQYQNKQYYQDKQYYKNKQYHQNKQNYRERRPFKVVDLLDEDQNSGSDSKFNSSKTKLPPRRSN